MKKNYYIDAGVEHLHLHKCEISDNHERVEQDSVIKVNDTIKNLFKRNNLWAELTEASGERPNVFVTGKLAAIVVKALGFGYEIEPAAAIWSAGNFLSGKEPGKKIGIIDLSASGYIIIGLNKEGGLIDDNLIVNPRCGAGSGTNLSRILSKLGIDKNKVDETLKKFIGKEARAERNKISVRADRCGVFSCSATVSDKNQGIPLASALAVTLKSEVLKAVKKVSPKIEIVYLTGRVFIWQFARDCAEDYLASIGVGRVLFDEKQILSLDGLKHLTKIIGLENFKKKELIKVAKGEAMVEYPSFSSLLENYTKNKFYFREKDPFIAGKADGISNRPVVIGLDIGSTMAKIIIADALTHDFLYLDSLGNHGDTVETVKHIFRSLRDRGIAELNIQQIGITGSGRYQVQKILSETYLCLRGRVAVLVENYAHARGSLAEVKKQIVKITGSGEIVNQDFCLLVDVGGEDTKISVVSLKNNDLFDNAMNMKCSAGTGSLMDTLISMFNIENVSLAAAMAMTAKKSYGLNATCAVFLIENARKLQAQGYAQKEILASCYWAIVENMARTLWSQIDFPKNAVAILHGQTMLSEPLPLAITHRLQEYTGSKIHAYVPPFPGHRACFGLIKGMKSQELISERCDLSLFIDREFTKQIFICHGAACHDKNASCVRSMLTYSDKAGVKKFILLGGCTAVNEKEASLEPIVSLNLNSRKNIYKDIWQMADNEFEKSGADNRLVIPRSFSGSEQAFFFQKIFSYFNIPVLVDNVRASDILEAQPKMSIDTCAPMIGAIGQFSRLAGEKHGIIFIAQLDFLPTNNVSLGRTCTTNQGGVVIAMNLAKAENPRANFILADISLSKKASSALADSLFIDLQSVFKFYNRQVTLEEMKQAVALAIIAEENLQDRLSDFAAAEISAAAGKQIVVVCGREYILNPGIYDSHVGRLFSDKGAIAIPSYLFDGDLDKDFSSVYWRNPHQLLSVIQAVKEKRLHQITKNKNLAKILSNIEGGDDKANPIGVIYVSTFHCGPDSMILQAVQEITREIPFLIIQSDAAINELAHLENRVNTFLGQLADEAGNNLKAGKFKFKIEFLDKFSAKSLDKKQDVIYFPTMEDNRMLTAVLKSAGYLCLDNYSDDTYDLQKIIKFGRRFTGDAVCAPFAAVFADTLLAVTDFIAHKKRGELIGRKRVIIFNNKGTGPCRQGQYYEMHRLLLYRELKTYLSSLQNETGGFSPDEEIIVQYIVGHEENSYNIGLDSWALIEAFQSLVMQGVLHAVFFEASRVCGTLEEYKNYRLDFLSLKQKVFNIFANVKPNLINRSIIKFTAKIPGLNLIALYFLSGIINNNGLRKILRSFSKKWKFSSVPRRQLKIYAEGEAYMRVAQIEEVYKNLIDDLGVNGFEFSYSPAWLYLEYLLENIILKIDKIKNTPEYGWARYFNKLSIKLAIILFRAILIKPLYRSSGLTEPARMCQVLGRAKEILPTSKPYGELAPYVGEALLKLDSGTELFLNISPEGCMVAIMGDMLTKNVYNSAIKRKKNARIQGLFSTDGEINNDKLIIALLKILGPEKYYRKN